MNKLKIALIVFMAFSTLTSSARRVRRMAYDGMLRTGLHIGAQGSMNSTWILKQNNYNTLNLFDIPIVRESDMDYVFTWGGQIGGEIGYNFVKRFGIEFHPSFSWAGQTYDDNFQGPVAAISNPNGGPNAPQYIPDPSVVANPVDPKTPTPYFVGSFNYVNVRREVKFTYLQFPIYAKYQTHIGDIASYYLMVGPQFNYRESGSEKIWVNYWQYKYPNELSVNQKFQKFDYGVSLNTGVDIYANDWMYFNVGVVSFLAINDLNGSTLKDLGWFSKNNVTYRESRNFYMGLHGGVHFYLDRRRYY